MNSVMPIMLLLVMLGVMYLMIIRPQKKREKETAQMLNSIQVGDEVVTTGGIIGRVTVVKEDNLIIESGNDRTKIRIKRYAVQSREPVETA